MTLTTWAVDEHLSDAQVIRQSIGSLIGAAGGLVAAGGLALTQKGTPNMSVLVAGGTPAEGGCWLPGYTTSTGPYYFQNSASYEQVIETAGASNPRVDTIIARVYDTNLDSSGKHEPILAALKGAEESGCTLANKKGVAAVPKSSLVLGYVLVEAKASSIVTADIANVAALVGPPTGFVTASALAAEAVTAPKLGAAAVTASKLGLGTVRQEGEPAQSFLSWGEISGTGAILSGSGDFTAAKVETGKYEVTWTKEKSSANYAVSITCANKNCVATVETTTAKGFVMRQFSENLAVGVAFSFLCCASS